MCGDVPLAVIIRASGNTTDGPSPELAFVLI